MKVMSQINLSQTYSVLLSQSKKPEVDCLHTCMTDERNSLEGCFETKLTLIVSSKSARSMG